MGEELPGAFLPRKSHSRGWEEAHAAGAAVATRPWWPLWQDGGADQGCGAAAVFPPLCLGGVSACVSLGKGLCLRAVNHAETWHAWHCPLCLLSTEPPLGPTLKVPQGLCHLACVCCGLLGSPFPSWGAAAPLPAAAPCGAVRGGYLQQLLLFPAWLQARALAGDLEGKGVQRDAPPPPNTHTPACCRAAPHTHRAAGA